MKSAFRQNAYGRKRVTGPYRRLTYKIFKVHASSSKSFPAIRMLSAAAVSGSAILLPDGIKQEKIFPVFHKISACLPGRHLLDLRIKGIETRHQIVELIFRQFRLAKAGDLTFMEVPSSKTKYTGALNFSSIAISLSLITCWIGVSVCLH